ncbi:hypothetical protein [Sphingobacterium sp. SYP-B4668]|uniref:hypothetical protein n=1 Tax=Sphingobacterium sp. SYP-B4668 TaxID=2996035 RepID=UPI0012E0B926|nr:hypothetical protein [Sphingobacterium sp. SYP-B4668]
MDDGIINHHILLKKVVFLERMHHICDIDNKNEIKACKYRVVVAQQLMLWQLSIA